MNTQDRRSAAGSIWAATGLHFAWNFILFNVFGLNLTGNDAASAAIFDLRSVGANILNGGEYGIEASVITAVILTAAALIIGFCGRKAAKKREEV